MDPSTGFLTFIIKNGVSGLLLVLTYFLVRHHLNTIKEHRVEIETITKEKNELEKELRVKIEELLTGQIEQNKPITEALIENSKIIDGLKERDEHIVEALEETNRLLRENKKKDE